MTILILVLLALVFWEWVFAGLVFFVVGVLPYIIVATIITIGFGWIGGLLAWPVALVIMGSTILNNLSAEKK
jgi:hypothetical protein